MLNDKLVEELHKPIIRKFEILKVYSPFKGNILGANSVDMQLISKFNKRFLFLLCVVDIYNKYAWVVPLKDKNGITITNAFHKIWNGSERKESKIQVDKGSKFYNRSMKLWLKDFDIEMYLRHNEGNSILPKNLYNLKN